MSTDLDLSDFYETHLLEVLTRSFLPGRPPIDIPPYQRPYRWSISEVRKLLDDLDSFRYNPETNEYDEGARYYYGTICFQAYFDRQTHRVSKLELIENRMKSQKTTFETLKSENEDIDVTETAINLKSAEMTYEAALMATGKVMQTTLLNFI